MDKKLLHEHNAASESLSVRYHYLDNLRASAMLLGVFFHASLAYSPFMQELWLSADARNSVIADVFAWWVHLFRMPLFFLIAGFFCHYMFKKRGMLGLLKNRALRILLPFILFLPLSIFYVIGLVSFAIEHTEISTPFVEFLVESGDEFSKRQDISTMHLWFLINLVFFYLVTALVYRLKKFHIIWQFIMLRSKLFLLCFPLLLIPALLTQTIPHPAPERIYPQLWSFGYFGVFFAMGWQFFNAQNWLDTIKPYWIPMLVFGILFYLFIFFNLPQSPTIADAIKYSNQAPPLTIHHVLGVMAEAYCAIYWVLLALLLARQLWNREQKWMRYIADSSYWVYIMHIPAIFTVQLQLTRVDWPIWIEYSISSFGVILIGILTYAVFVRKPPIGWMLNGRR